jgi:hypothetical protein
MSKRKDILDTMQDDIAFHAGTVCSGISCIQDAYELGVDPRKLPNLFFSNYRNNVRLKDLLEYLEGR